MRRSALRASAISLAIALGGPALADSFTPLAPVTYPLGPYEFAYITMGGGAQVRRLPTFNASIRDNADNSLIFSHDPKFVMGGGQGTIGFRVFETWLPGLNPRIEGSFGFWHGTSIVTGGTSDFIPSSTIFSIDGTRAVGCGSCQGTTDLRIRNTELNGTLTFKVDLGLTPQFALTPSIGFLGGHSETKYRADTPLFFGTPGVFPPTYVEEIVQTTRIGGEVGLDGTWRVIPKVSLTGGAGISFFHMHTTLNGHDCFAGNQPGGVCDNSPVLIFSTSTQQSDSRFAYRLNFRAGATYDAGWFKVSLGGFGARDNAVPGVANPAALGQTAHIIYDAKWSYGGFAAVTVPFFIR